jgi:hypothetical protein
MRPALREVEWVTWDAHDGSKPGEVLHVRTGAVGRGHLCAEGTQCQLVRVHLEDLT